MWKKFTDLLFEDDEIIDDEETQEVVQKPVKVVKPVQPVENIEKPKQVFFEEPVKKEEVREVIEEKPKSIGINIDELQEIKTPAAEKIQNNRPTIQSDTRVAREPIKPIQKPRVSSNKPDGKFNYEFTPVISPIFGVSEKDVDAVIPTNPNKKKPTIDSRIGTVISPMYGFDRDNEPDVISAKVSPKVSTISEKEAEEEIVNFSLDEILARRDSEAALDNPSILETGTLDEVDRTTVLSNYNMSLFDDEE